MNNAVKYKSVYAFKVADYVKSGKEVFVLDRSSLSAMAISEMNAIDFINAINDDETNRYEFWIEEEIVTEEQEETANE